jgi:hypothetical protein
MGTATLTPAEEAEALARIEIARGEEREHVEAKLTEFGLSADDAKREYEMARAVVRRQVAEEQVAEAQAEAHDTAAESERGAIEKALFEDTDDGWTADGPAREPIPGSCGLLRRGVGTYVYGPREGGKSTVILTAALGAAMAGERVVYFDRENDPTLTRERLMAAISAQPEFDEATLRENFHPLHYPQFGKTWTPETFADAIEARGYSVVIYDSVRELCDQLGVSANSDDEFSRLYTLLGTSLIRRGITPVFLDNVGNKNTFRPTGTHAKLDVATQGYHVKSLNAFSPDRQGTAEVNCSRSRNGDKGRRWLMAVGGGRWDLPTEDIDAVPISDNGRILAALSAEDREAPKVAKQLGMSTVTLMRHVDELNTPEQRDSDEVGDYQFKPPINVTKRPGTSTLLALRADLAGDM